MGVLHSELLRGKEVFSFEYEQDWLQRGFAQVLDPELDLYSGLHFLKDDKVNFGAFSSTSGQTSLMNQFTASIFGSHSSDPK